MSSTHQPGRLNGDSPVFNAACAPEPVQGKVDECTHKGEADFEHCHCICDDCGFEDCICVAGDENDSGDDYWRRVDAEMDLLRDGF